MESNIEIYQSDDGKTEIKVKFEEDTIWLSQQQMASLFEKDVRTINEHIKTIYNTGELMKDSTIRNFRIVQKEGSRNVKRAIIHYNLDMVISVGYRVNSIRGTQFRQWATQKLKSYLLDGFLINKKRLAEKKKEVQVLKDGIKILNRAIENHIDSGDFKWLNYFAKGLALLDDYDHQSLDFEGKSKKEIIYPTYDEYMDLIKNMREHYDSDLFARQKDESFRSSINQIKQNIGNIELYRTLEEKAAMLLYFIVKNHSFTDGNKRIAAACFLYFLERNHSLVNENGQTIISNEAIAGLTLYIAISRREEMNTVKKLVISFLNRNLNQI